MSGCAQLHFAKGRDTPGLAAMLCCPFVSSCKDLLVVHEEEQGQGRDKAIIGATICTGGHVKGMSVPLLPGAGPSLLHPQECQALRLMAKGEVCFRHNSRFIAIWISRESVKGQFCCGKQDIRALRERVQNKIHFKN